MGIIEVLLGLGIIGYLIYHFFFSFQNYWKDRDVAGPKPHPLFGNLKQQIYMRESIGEFGKRMYFSFPNEPVVGAFARSTPILILRDPEIIKEVLIKSFSNFVSRGMRIHEKVEPLSQHLFLLEPKRWRPLRTKLSPVFTSGRLKDMFYIIQDCCTYFDTMLEKLVEKGEPIEVRDIFAKFTTDIIGSCAFGLNMKSEAEEDCAFRKMGKKVFEVNSLKSLIRFRIRDMMPWLYDLLAPIFYDKEVTEFFLNSIVQTIKYREKENIRRHDFVDLLRDIQKNPESVGDIEMTDVMVASQAFVFFLAGFETSSTALAYISYELALNQNIQDKLRDEVLQEMKKCNGKLTYESIKNLKYMDRVMLETLRKYPPAPILMRESENEHTFSVGKKLTIPAKMKVWIPVLGLHHDPEIFPKPHVFDPDRFSEENIKTRHPMFHLPFGDGPRNCIGERFAVYQVKSGLAQVIQHYKILPCNKTEVPLTINPVSFIHSPLNGVYLKFTKLNREEVTRL